MRRSTLTPDAIKPANSGAPAVGPRSLEDVHSTVPVEHARFWRRLFAFSGPAYLVSVGYMDPGNWATDIAGGAKFNYELIWVLLMSNVMAVVLQTLSARLGIVAGRDLAQACRDNYSRPMSVILWLLCEVAIVACDLAEVVGTVIGLKLLFGLEPLYGLVLTALDTFLFLAIQRLGIRKMEAFILVLIVTIGLCFGLEIILARPDWGPVLHGFIPHLTSQAPFVFSSSEAMFVAIGIIGATVMPHNLYLHSALVQSRRIQQTDAGLTQACKFNLLDSLFALNGAFFVNAAILVMAAATFYNLPEWQGREIQLEDAHHLLSGLLGTRIAPIAFALALLCSGQSSTITGTLAGQIVMEGFVHLRIRPWLRRLITRSLAIVPAMLMILLRHDEGMMGLLIVSQVVLSLQLPFAIIPLLQFTASRKVMGKYVTPLWGQALGWLTAAIIIALDAVATYGQINDWIQEIEAAGGSALWLQLTAIPLAVGCGLFLGWILLMPWLRRAPRRRADGIRAQATAREVTEGLSTPQYQRIGVALDHSPNDAITLRHAVSLARQHQAELVLLHVVESVGGQLLGRDADDQERRDDQVYIDEVASSLRAIGVAARPALAFGTPARELSRAVADEQIDFLVLGSHGHGFLGDRLFGETVGAVRHAVKIPVLAVREPTK